MYIRSKHRLADPDAVQALMTEHPLGAWVYQGSQGLVANHVPFFLDRSRGPLGTLIGHVARANPVWHDLQPGRPSVVMFQGPQSYITPGWYPGKLEHGKVVPTWNYAVAHAHGVARSFEDRDDLLDMLQKLTHAQERHRLAPWQVSDAPTEYLNKLLRGIVGIEIPIDRLEGKLKASQDEDLPDRMGTVQGLREDASDASLAMADLVEEAMRLQTPPP